MNLAVNLLAFHLVNHQEDQVFLLAVSHLDFQVVILRFLLVYLLVNHQLYLHSILVASQQSILHINPPESHQGIQAHILRALPVCPLAFLQDQRHAHQTFQAVSLLEFHLVVQPCRPVFLAFFPRGSLLASQLLIQLVRREYRLLIHLSQQLFRLGNLLDSLHSLHLLRLENHLENLVFGQLDQQVSRPVLLLNPLS